MFGGSQGSTKSMLKGDRRSGSAKSGKSSGDEEEGKINPKDIRTDHEIYSKTVKVGRVEDFKWKYEEKVWDGGSKRFRMVPVSISGIQAIYVNPKWRKS